MTRDHLSEAISTGAYPVVILGDVGSGKSCAMACVYAWVDGQVQWWHAMEFVRLIQLCRKDGSVMLPGCSYETSESALWRVRVEQPAVLFVDDIGTAAPTDSECKILYELAERRGTKPMFVSSNLTMVELDQVYDRRFVSRLLRGTVIEMQGDDRRLQNTKICRVG